MAVSHIGNSWKQTDFSEPSPDIIRKWLKENINRENEHILSAASHFSDLEGMGTTIVCAAYFNGEILLCNVGDSRIYGYRQGTMTQLTEDHSFINELRRSGQFREEDIELHINKHALTRSLGVNEEIKADFHLLKVADYTHLLLCSDGLSNVVSSEEIAMIFSENENDAEMISQKLVDKALANQGTDNITVAVIDHHSESRTEEDDA